VSNCSIVAVIGAPGRSRRLPWTIDIEDLYLKNLLVQGQHDVGEKRVDLEQINCPLLTVAADKDTICPPAAAVAINPLVGSKDEGSRGPWWPRERSRGKQSRQHAVPGPHHLDERENRMNLKELKIVVTGGAQGMGAHFATRLFEAGAQVAVGDVNEEGLKALPKGIHTRRLDVSKEDDIIGFVNWAFDAMGGLNGLINNAGILKDGLLVKKDKTTGQVVKMSLDQFNAVINVNLIGATLMVREVVAKMVEKDQGPGVIVNMSSIARHGNRGQSNYVSAKAALAANTVTWMKEFAPFRIRVGAIAPGMVETPMTKGMNQKALDGFIANIPVGRIGVPEDLWVAVKFVLECDYFNGRTIDVDGGMGF